jgi:hypothetical protein
MATNTATIIDTPRPPQQSSGERSSNQPMTDTAPAYHPPMTIDQAVNIAWVYRRCADGLAKWGRPRDAAIAMRASNWWAAYAGALRDGTELPKLPEDGR